ncbi:MAG: PilZ domain-containing protein [Candidatus Omnitrophota bacterium]
MAKQIAEKRKYLRLHSPLKVEYTIENSDKIYVETTQDLSAFGFKLLSDNQHLTQGNRVALTLNLPKAQNPVHAIGRVAWLTKNAEPTTPTMDVGIEIAEIEEDNKNTFLRYLCDLLYG